MKCQKCGKSEVSFHYSSNINGSVTETFLCSGCAASLGYDFGKIFSAGDAFGGFPPVFGMPGGFLPVSFSGQTGNSPFQLALQTRLGTGINDGTCRCGCETRAPDVSETVVDDEMSKRREVNMLREQMRQAAESDDFEKAIELREKIKEFEV